MEHLGAVKHSDPDNHCMGKWVSDNSLLPSCKDPITHSEAKMISEESKMSPDAQMGDKLCCEKDISTCYKGISADVGMHENQSPSDARDCKNLDWGDDDSWDDDYDYSKENEDLWESLCQYIDPYNPLNFAMPIQSRKQEVRKTREITENSRPEISKDIEFQLREKLTFNENDHDNDDNICTRKYRKPPLLSSFVRIPKQECHITSNAQGVPEVECAEEPQTTRSGHDKRVRFSPNITVRTIVCWSFAHRMARIGPWQEYARDRYHFQRRIDETEAAISFCLEPSHRENVWKNLHQMDNE